MIFKLMYSKKLGVQAGELFNRGMDVIRHAHGTESDPFAFHLWVIEWMQGVWRESIDGMWWDSGIQNMVSILPELCSAHLTNIDESWTRGATKSGSGSAA